MGDLTPSIQDYLGQVSMKPGQAQSGAGEPDAGPAIVENIQGHNNFLDKASGQIIEAEAGVCRIEATTAVWGKRGKWFVIAGLVSRHQFPIFKCY
jgi:hypothetical protein